ncbi:MAG: TonB-dependent receptor domain-containing protein [Vicinamibacterales bacterium]
MRSLMAKVLVLCTLAAPAAAQVVGANLSGTITDEGGGALPGVTVTVLNKANGTQQVVVTSSEGVYRVVSLQPAPYLVTAELTGFGGAKRELVLTIGANVTLDLKLGVAAIEESITVSAQAPVIEVARAAPSSTIVEGQIQALPVLERNFLALAQIMPGAAPNYISKFSRVKFGGPADQRNGYTTIVDGGDLDDAIWGDPTVNVSQDAVQEFKVFRNQFDAQYGAALAAVVTVATKSGTNDFHGSSYFFGRDDALNARNAFSRTKPVYGQQRFGGSFGGPVVVNRTHFFGAYEYTNVDKENIIALPGSNPFAARENGTFPATSREHLLLTKWDHRLTDRQSVFIRYAFDDQYATRTSSVSADSANVNDSSKMHSVIGEQNWVLSSSTVNTLRAHYMWNEVATLPVVRGVPQEVRPSVTTGQNWTSPQFFPRTRIQLFETLYKTAGRHDLKVGGDYTYAMHTYDAHFYESGYWQFSTDAPFSAANQATWPIAFIQQTTGVYDYNSHIFAAYAQDDWRVADRIRVNLGVRYDLDTNLRMNDVYARVLKDPAYRGLENFVTADRGTDADNIQPRFGVTYDVTGTGRFIARAGWGKYITRNRHYFGLTAQDRLLGTAVRIEDPNQLRLYPDIRAVLGGKSLSDYVAGGAARSVYLIPDNYVLPESQNSTIGFGWQIASATGIEVDFVHAYGYNQLGGKDLNLPASGRVSAANPRPVSQFTEVKSLENFTKSWYNALETQFRTRVGRIDSLTVSYTLSGTTRDGVNHYQTYPGTMRTPHEQGYSEQDTRHNLSLSAATRLPYDVSFSTILRALSGTPYGVSAGFDIDGDGQTQNDRPGGLPITVGREKVAESLKIINDLRATRNLAPISIDQLELEPFISLDLRFTKDFRIGQGRRIEVFLEGYNVLNRVNYAGGGNGSIISPALLVRNAARDARQIQLGGRVTF